MSGAPVVAPGPSFRSLLRPELVLDPIEDVSVCETCEGTDSDGCPDCRGHHLVHGYGPGGIGLPVVMEDRREVATPAHTGPEAHSRGSRGTRLPLSTGPAA